VFCFAQCENNPPPVQQCHTYLLSYYPTGTRVLPGRVPVNELPDNGSSTHGRREAEQESEISEVRTPTVRCRRVATDNCAVERRPFTTPRITTTRIEKSSKLNILSTGLVLIKCFC